MPTWGEILQELGKLQGSQDVPPGLTVFDFVRRKYLQTLSQYTNRNVILYASKWTQPGTEPEVISITPEDVQGFMEVVHGMKGEMGLDLILHSPGGSAEVTESLVNYLRFKFKDIRVLVPQAAMSAASMLTCAANRIVMGAHSSLGPIDPQFIVMTDLGRASVPARAILEQFARAREECRDPALLPSWLPTLRQYGPALLVQCQLALELAESLVSDWLATYMFAGAPGAQEKAVRIARELSDHTSMKSHGRFLSRERVKQLGLIVEDLEDDRVLQDALLSVFHATTHTFNGTPAVKLIENHIGKAFIKVQPVMVVRQPPGSPPNQPTAS